MLTVYFSVFLLYNKVVHSEDINNNLDEEEVVKVSNQNQLDVAHDKIKLLESKLQELEARLPKVSGVFPEIKFRNYKDKKRILVTGGAGFVGSHLVDTLMLGKYDMI